MYMYIHVYMHVHVYEVKFCVHKSSYSIFSPIFLSKFSDLNYNNLYIFYHLSLFKRAQILDLFDCIHVAYNTYSTVPGI